MGPRQAGKTTLVKELFPDYTYVNLEDRVTRELAENDYEGFFYKFPEPMIIDEVQRVPELLSAIQVKVDEDRRKNGRFILTGSHQPRLREAVAQSLAGRTTIQGLAAYLLGIETSRQASRDPLRGNLFYMRTEKGVEVDLILEKEGCLYPYEIKSSMTPNKEFSKSMKQFCNSEANTGKMSVLYCGEPYDSFEGTKYIHYNSIAECIREQ